MCSLAFYCPKLARLLFEYYLWYKERLRYNSEKLVLIRACRSPISFPSTSYLFSVYRRPTSSPSQLMLNISIISFSLSQSQSWSIQETSFQMLNLFRSRIGYKRKQQNSRIYRSSSVVPGVCCFRSRDKNIFFIFSHFLFPIPIPLWVD